MIGDPFDLDRRAVIPAITTLTLRRTGATASFLLHWRDPDRVATAGGTYDVIPAGEFQPSSMAPGDQRTDFDLWRNMAREFSEELLGEPEYDGSRGRPVDFPFTEENVTRLLGSEPMASPGAACLTLAWRHRAALLSE